MLQRECRHGRRLRKWAALSCGPRHSLERRTRCCRHGIAANTPSYRTRVTRSYYRNGRSKVQKSPEELTTAVSRKKRCSSIPHLVVFGLETVVREWVGWSRVDQSPDRQCHRDAISSLGMQSTDNRTPVQRATPPFHLGGPLASSWAIG